MNKGKEIGKLRNPFIDELLAHDPLLPHRTMARILCAEHPELFASINSARDAVRGRTGNHGVILRKQMKNTHEGTFREGFTGEALPVPTPFWDSTPFIFNTRKCLIMADLHIPFHCNAAIERAVKEAKKAGCKDVLLLGDVLDHYQESDFMRVPDVSTLGQELKDGQQFLRWLRKRFKGRIIYKEGNHEERWANRVHKALPEAQRLLDLLTYEQMKVEDMGIEIVRERRRIVMGYLTAIHGHELGPGTYNPVNCARTLQLKAKEISLCAHWHQPCQHRVRTISQKHIGCWGIGCLCILTPHYRPINDWNMGAAIFERLDTKGNFRIQNGTIIDGNWY